MANFWSRLELRHLAVLTAIATEGSFWAAADHLDCSPSAVSQQLAALEKISGQRLVERARGRRNVRLTEAGSLLLRHAEAIVARLQAAAADFSAFEEGDSGRLRVGMYQSVGTRIVPRLLREFALQWPAVELQLTEGAGDERLLAMVEAGELDLTFTTLPVPAGPFESLAMMRDPYVLAVSRESELAGRRSTIPAEHLASLHLIGIRSCQAQVESQLRSHGLEPKIGFHSNDNSVVEGLVAAGVGAAIVPLLTMDEDNGKIVLLPIDGFPARVLALAWHRDRYRSPAARAFVERARAICAELEQRHAARATAVSSGR